MIPHKPTVLEINCKNRTISILERRKKQVEERRKKGELIPIEIEIKKREKVTNRLLAPKRKKTKSPKKIKNEPVHIPRFRRTIFPKGTSEATKAKVKKHNRHLYYLRHKEELARISRERNREKRLKNVEKEINNRTKYHNVEL